MRDVLAAMFMLFIGGWFIYLAWLVISMRIQEMDILVALGVGTATGVFLKCFGDMWQFYFRKKGGR